MSMVDPSILDTLAYKIVQKDFQAAIEEGPTYICDICYKYEYKTNVIQLNPSKYEKELFDKCHTGKSEWICKVCHNSMSKNKKMPMQAQANNLQLCPKFEELECLCPIELMLISQIIPFMFIVAKHKGAQHGLKGQCVLVPADLQKVQTVLPRSCNEEYLISLALKRRLSDKSVVNKQNIRPALVNKALQKLKEINPFYKDVSIDTTWENVSEQSDPELWKLLTDENAKTQNDETDSDDEIEGNDQAHEKEKRMSSVPYPTVLHNIDGPNISADQIVNVAPGEGQIPVSVTSEPDWEALTFPKEYSTGKNHYNESREIPITPSKYVHARLKCCDDRFASNPQYIFHALDWIEKHAVASTIHFTERKQFQSDVSAGQLANSDNVRRMISDDQIFASFKNIRGTPQYFRNMMLDVLAKIRQYGVTTFFLTFSAAEFQWPEIIQIVARQKGIILSTEEVNEMDWSTKVKYLKMNPVTVARQIDYIFRQVFGKILYSSMHPIGQILNHDDRREFQGRGVEHPHASIHIVNAPKIDENEDSEVEEFIDKYITCSLPDEDEYPELNNLVKRVQTHHHTTTCRKKKGVTCRFHFPWPPSEKTRIVRGGDVDKDKLKQSKRVLDKVLEEITSRIDLFDVTLRDILEGCNMSETEYDDALECVQKKVTIIYKRRPVEKDISPYNTVILSLLKSNMNIQFVTGVYGLLTYLTSYLCKPEHTMSELMKKASKEAFDKDLKGKLRSIGAIFVTTREVSTHEALVRVLSLPMRTSRIDTIYVNTGIKKNRTRVLKSQSILETMNPEDTNVYATNMIEKYANRPDDLEQMCYADFATNYISTKADEVQVESEDIKNYTMPVSAIDDVEPSSIVIVLKDELGKMRKRSRPCVMRYHKVSKMKDPEQYYLTLLQLYMPWRNEDELKGTFRTCEEKYNLVELTIKPNILKHDPYFDQYEINEDDLLDDCYSTSEAESEEDNDDFSMINPDLLDLDMDEDNDANNVPIASTTVQSRSLPPEMYYKMCSQLNERQQLLFNYIMKYATERRLYKRNKQPKPQPFKIFLSGGAGVGKSFIVHLITEYLKNVLRYPGQNWDEQPSIVVAASTGKAATNIHGTTLHSAFSLPVKIGGIVNRKNLANSHEDLHKLRIKYKYLKIILTDEISMTGKYTFDMLNKHLQLIKNNKLVFGGVCILLIGDFNQLPPVKQKNIYSDLRINDTWDLFILHELHEIVRQSSDPEFAQLLNRLREGNQTPADIQEIKALANTDTSTWPEDYVKLYVTNDLANKKNDECMKKLETDGATVVTIFAKDSRKDKRTSRCPINIGEDVKISDTGNLVKSFRTCVGARVLYTDNKDIGDRLINGLMGTVQHLDRVKHNKHPVGTIYVRFDDQQAGNKLKDTRLRSELKQCVPVVPIVKQFRYMNKDVERKQFPLILAHAMTIHKSQGSTIEYLSGDLDQTSKTGKKGRVPIGPGMVYTLLSRATSRDKLQLLNFKENQINVNQSAVEEMERMRRECVLSWNHPLTEMSGKKICLFNIRSWNLHIEHFLSDAVYSTYSSIFCFTETHINNNRPNKNIEDYEKGWANIHKPTEHGLAICYDTTKVEIVQEFHLAAGLQLLPVLIKIEGELVLLVLVYRPPRSVGTFIQQLIDELGTLSMLITLPTDEYRTLIVGDFNLDQMLPENVALLEPLITRFNVHQRSHYSTHIHGGILDLVFDDMQSESVEWMPSPYSDHFVLLIQF